MRKYVWCKTGNGKSIFLWHDKWWGPNSLSDRIQMNEVTLAGFDQNMKLKDMVCNGQWRWPADWIHRFTVLQTIPVPNFQENSSDYYFWCTNDARQCKYSTNRTWKDWKSNGDKVEWSDLIWFSHCTPKHSFIMWIAMNGRLSTQDRLLKWYPDRIMKCALCETCPDSINHLFFECTYSQKIWKDFKIRSGNEALPDKWEDLIQSMSKLKCNKSINSILRRVGLAACVYYIWNERNKRIFGNAKREEGELLKIIVNHLRLKLSSLQVKKTKHVTDVCNKWKITMNLRNEDETILPDFTI